MKIGIKHFNILKLNTYFFSVMLVIVSKLIFISYNIFDRVKPIYLYF